MTAIAPRTRAIARRLRAEMTPNERQLWPKLRELNQMLGTHFRRQAAIGPYIVDFAELGRRLVIEVDGGQHGGEADHARDAWLAGQGFRVLRVWNSDVAGNIKGVMQVVLDALEAAPPPQPSPTRGEGATRLEPLVHVGGSSVFPPPRGEGLGVGGGEQRITPK